MVTTAPPGLSEVRPAWWNEERGSLKSLMGAETSSQPICGIQDDIWKPLPFPVIVDSGASESVIPMTWAPQCQIVETELSKAKKKYHAANGGEVTNVGQKVMGLWTDDGVVRDMVFQACDKVDKALGSVSRICAKRNRVVYNPGDHPEGSYIEHLDIGLRVPLVEQNGIYLLMAGVGPPSNPFIGRGQ